MAKPHRKTSGIQLPVRTTFVLAFLISSAAGFTAYCCCGNSLDLMIAGLIFTSLIAPPLTATAGQLPGSLWISLLVVIGIGSSWLMPVLGGAITISQLIQCIIVCTSLALLLAMLVQLLIRLGVCAVAASAATITLGMAWLTWPIWLAASLSGSQLRLSVLIHPLFAFNHVVSNLGIWTEQQRAYSLTNFGQDVQYQLPVSILPALAFHFGMFWLALSICFACSRIAPRSINQMETDASAVSNK